MHDITKSMRCQQDIGLVARSVPGIRPLEQCPFGLLDPLYAKESLRRSIQPSSLFRASLLRVLNVAFGTPSCSYAWKLRISRIPPITPGDRARENIDKLLIRSTLRAKLRSLPELIPEAANRCVHAFRIPDKVTARLSRPRSPSPKSVIRDFYN